MDKQAEIMRETIRLVSTAKTYSIDVDKINNLDDVKKILEGLAIQVTVLDGIENKQYEALKEYLK